MANWKTMNGYLLLKLLSCSKRDNSSFLNSVCLQDRVGLQCLPVACFERSYNVLQDTAAYANMSLVRNRKQKQSDGEGEVGRICTQWCIMCRYLVTHQQKENWWESFTVLQHVFSSSMSNISWNSNHPWCDVFFLFLSFAGNLKCILMCSS